MPNSLTKILSIILYVLLGISLVIFALIYIGGTTPETADAVYKEPIYSNLLLNWTYILIIGTALIAIGFPLANAITNPKNIKKAIIPLVGFGVIFLIAYLISSDKPITLGGGDVFDNTFILRYSDIVIISVYILIGIAVISIIYSGVARLLKK